MPRGYQIDYAASARHCRMIGALSALKQDVRNGKLDRSLSVKEVAQKYRGLTQKQVREVLASL